MTDFIEMKLPATFVYDFETRGMATREDFEIVKWPKSGKGPVTVRLSAKGLHDLRCDAVEYSDMRRWVSQDPDNRWLVMSAQAVVRHIDALKAGA